MNEPANQLASWKQIAAYLGVTQRTAQNWEKQRGLPVTRIPGGRGRVTADQAALDAWQAGLSAEPRTPENLVQPRSVSVKLLAFLVLLIVLAVTAVLAWRLSDTRTPAAYRIVGQTVLILDQHGREFWSHTGIGSEQYWQNMSLWSSVPVRIQDLDGDGANEVLIVRGFTEGTESWWLICYSSDGEEHWRFQSGGTVRTNDTEFGNPFGIRFFAVSSSVPAKIAVSSTHHTEFPNQVALLSHLGELEGEYWHSGWLTTLSFLDFDGDGADELFAGGVSNASDRATVVVLAPENIRGASAEPAGFQLLGMETNRELLRAFFPRTCLNKKRQPRSFVREIKRVDEGLSVYTLEVNSPEKWAGVFHFLSPEFKTIRTIPQGEFDVAHRQAFEFGEITHEFSQAELSELGAVEIIRPGN